MKLLQDPVEKSHGAYIHTIQRESCKKLSVPDDFWVEEPRCSENISEENRYFYRSTRLFCGTTGSKLFNFQ